MSVSQSGGDPHPIRLRGPWRYAWRGGIEPACGTMRHPDEWPRRVAEQGGAIELSRRFHAPTNLEARERVFVVLTGVLGSGEVLLNGQRIGSFTREQSRWEFELPQPLAFFNELTVSVSFPPPSEETTEVGLYDVVVLEIRQA